MKWKNEGTQETIEERKRKWKGSDECGAKKGRSERKEGLKRYG